MAVRVEVLGSGSKGNCTFVQGGRSRVLIDAGLSCKEIGRRLGEIGEDPDDLDAVLVTHAHSDHVRGVRVLARKHRLPVACHSVCWRDSKLAEQDLPEWLPLEAGRAFTLGDLEIEPFAVPHDAEPTVGFRMRAEGISVGYCTDLGHVTAVVRDRLSGVQVLVLESNHDLDMLRDGPYPWVLKQRVGGRHGHLSNEASAGLLDELVHSDLAFVALAHLSETNNDAALALSLAEDVLRRHGREDVRLVAAAQDVVSHVGIA
jgi:phosphoribosyl 1,2-cyclic phosphodiesterase